jgi:hypothetical protein
VTATISQLGQPDLDVEDVATLYPIPYHLIDLRTPNFPATFEATDRYTYNITIENIGNLDEVVYLEVPLLEQLNDLDFETDLDVDTFDNVEPGKEYYATLKIKAPLEIARNYTFEMVIKAYTLDLDPSTLEPASSEEIRIDMELIKSKVNRPEPDTDTDDEPDDDDEPKDPLTPSKEPGLTEDTPGWLVVIVLGFIFLIIIFIIFAIRKGGGGEEDDQDMEDTHASMVRI